MAFCLSLPLNVRIKCVNATFKYRTKRGTEWLFHVLLHKRKITYLHGALLCSLSSLCVPGFLELERGYGIDARKTMLFSMYVFIARVLDVHWGKNNDVLLVLKREPHHPECCQKCVMSMQWLITCPSICISPKVACCCVNETDISAECSFYLNVNSHRWTLAQLMITSSTILFLFFAH